MKIHSVCRECVVIAAVLISFPPSAPARGSNAGKIWKQAQAAEEQKDYEKALELYLAAERKDPSNPAYSIGERRVRFQASQAHIKAGEQDRGKGMLDAALNEFERAFKIDPSNALALQEARRTAEMIERNRRSDAPPGVENLTPVQAEERKQKSRINSMRPAPELKPILNRISALKMNNQPPKVFFETVCKLAGVNVIFDPQMQAGRNVNLDIEDATLEEALDYTSLLTKTYWKPVSRNTIFVTEDSATKRRDYEDQVVKVFYLKNVTSVQEFQEIVTAVRSATDNRPHRNGPTVMAQWVRQRGRLTIAAERSLVARACGVEACAEKTHRDR